MERRAITRSGGFRLPQHRRIRARIDFEQDLALLDFLAFAKIHLGNLTVDTRLDRYRGKCLDITDGIQLDRHTALLDQCCGYRNRSAFAGTALARTTFAGTTLARTAFSAVRRLRRGTVTRIQYIAI